MDRQYAYTLHPCIFSPKKNRRATSLINIFGLGLAGAMLAILFVVDEFSFDRFNRKGNHIYRINKFVTGPRALFGEVNPIGKSVNGLEGERLEITGVIKSPPRNSNLQFKG